MVTFGSRIRALAASLGKEEKDIAEELGLSKSKMSHYINGRNKVPSELLQQIVNKYKINPQFLFREGAPLYEVDKKKSLSNDYVYLPTTISAGLPMIADTVTEYNADKVSLPDSIMGKWAGSKGIYITKVNGDSMNKIIPDGSFIAVKPVELSGLKNGDIVVFSNGYEYSVKRYYKHDDKLVFRPESNNLAHFDQTYSVTDDITIHGKVVVYIVELD